MKKINSISIDNAILENADSVYCSKFLDIGLILVIGNQLEMKKI